MPEEEPIRKSSADKPEPSVSTINDFLGPHQFLLGIVVAMGGNVAALAVWVGISPTSMAFILVGLFLTFEMWRRRCSISKRVTRLRERFRHRSWFSMTERVVQLSAAPIWVLFLLVLIWAGSLHEQANRTRATEIVWGFLKAPNLAWMSYQNAGERVRGFAVDKSTQYLASEFELERRAGARSAPWLNSDAFWEALLVEDGELWKNGYWLELCRFPWPNPDNEGGIYHQLEEKMRRGSDREKYVAFCLIGQAADKLVEESKDGGTRKLLPGFDVLDEKCGPICVKAVAEESDPGVVSAAYWAAGKLERRVEYPPGLRAGQRVFKDDHSRLVFALLPATADFRPGSPMEEDDRYPDEDQPLVRIAIEPIWVSVTEVTWGQLDDWRRELQSLGEMVGELNAFLTSDLSKTKLAGSGSSAAVEGIRPRVAQITCDALTKTVKKADRQYRLLSETEWEYACRAGNAGAFCYGDSIDYFPNFAASVKTKDRIATKMPNAFGLFDVHGNVWEICATPYYKRYDDLLKEASLLEDPRVEPGSKLAKRGGAAYNAPTACRSALREIIMADEGLTKTGFRVVLEIKPVSAP